MKKNYYKIKKAHTLSKEHCLFSSDLFDCKLHKSELYQMLLDTGKKSVNCDSFAAIFRIVRNKSSLNASAFFSF